MTPDRVLELKAEAKRIRIERGLKHAVALDVVAQDEGYRTWMDLLADAGGAEAVREELQERPPTEAKVRRQERYAEHLLRAHH